MHLQPGGDLPGRRQVQAGEEGGGHSPQGRHPQREEPHLALQPPHPLSASFTAQGMQAHQHPVHRAGRETCVLNEVLENIMTDIGRLRLLSRIFFVNSMTYFWPPSAILNRHQSVFLVLKVGNNGHLP